MTLNPDALSKNSQEVLYDHLPAVLDQLVRAFETQGQARSDATRLAICLCFSAFAAQRDLLDGDALIGGLNAPGSSHHAPNERVPSHQALQSLLRRLWNTSVRAESPASSRQAIARAAIALLPPQAPPVEEATASLSTTQPVPPPLLSWCLETDWHTIEPALFGGLWERSLQARTRRQHGVHYTPRADVERLILPTVMQPLRDAWQAAQTSAEALALQGDVDGAATTLRAFQCSLTELRVLDPACGTGNFLYVTMEHVQALEHEVLQARRRLSDGAKHGSLAPRPAAPGPDDSGADDCTVDDSAADDSTADDSSADDVALCAELHAVHPSQFQGIELDKDSAQIAEVILWFSWLRMSLRVRGRLGGGAVPVAPPMVPPGAAEAPAASVRVADALISGWDGEDPTTAEQTPWPPSHYIIGNPPFLGARHIRSALVDSYVRALRTCYPDLPEHADLVMYWWARAAVEVGEGRAQQFGLITTNSILQPFSRKVVDAAFATYPDLELRHVIADHPWVHAGDGASVRVTLMTVGRGEDSPPAPQRQRASAQNHRSGLFNPPFGSETTLPKTSDHQFGPRANPHPPPPRSTLASPPASPLLLRPTTPLAENRGLACVGYQLSGKGFVMTSEEAARFLRKDPSLKTRIRPLLSGRDLMQTTRGLYAVDLFGLSLAEFHAEHPSLYRWLEPRVRAVRQTNARKSLRDRWWIFGEARSTFRPALAGKDRIWVTSLTAKHRVFASVPADWICDSTTVMFAIDDAQAAILSSRLHTAWAFASGGTLEDRPRYNKSTCFETYSFPSLKPPQSKVLAQLVRELDSLRWGWRYPVTTARAYTPTITRAYNRLNAVRLGETPTDDGAFEDDSPEEVGPVIQQLSALHDALDRAAFSAYGWDDLAEALVGKPGATTPLKEMGEGQRDAEAELMRRLVALAEARRV